MLTDIAIRAFKPGAKSYKRGDEKGLFILVHPLGSLLWRFKYRLHAWQDARWSLKNSIDSTEFAPSFLRAG